ncbi:hypothetical protein SPFM20_00271 [Salmonella phage SPFM20]|nr:hypothetical protein SPFM8_00270 [Salmonella phage SPFM8]VFR14949.1 hypothetical protein SPFM20_00271 [Salmonella phage SPFM20]
MRYRIFISVRVQEVVDGEWYNVFPAGVEVETSWEFLKDSDAQDPDGMVAQIKMDLENLYGSQSVVYRGNIKSLAYTQAVFARTPQEKARELMNHYTESGYSLNLTGANMIAVGTLSTRGWTIKSTPLSMRTIDRANITFPSLAVS